MKYRCPHCGERGFSFTHRIIPQRSLYNPEYVSCDYCRRGVTLFARWGGKIGNIITTLVLVLTPLVVGVWSLQFVPSQQEANPAETGLYYLLFWILPWSICVALLLLYRRLFCYFDKPVESGYISADKFRFTIPATVRLWPRVRVGEIYLIRFPKRKKIEGGPYLIGMVTKVEKDGESQEVTVRVVKEYLMDAPVTEEELVLTTEGNFSVEGVVSQTYRLPPQEE